MGQWKQISKKGDILMTSYCLPLLEMKTIYNGSIIGISLFNVGVPSREMCCEKAKAGIMII